MFVYNLHYNENIVSLVNSVLVANDFLIFEFLVWIMSVYNLLNMLKKNLICWYFTGTNFSNIIAIVLSLWFWPVLETAQLIRYLLKKSFKLFISNQRNIGSNVFLINTGLEKCCF